MKRWSRIQAALALAISMIFSTWPNIATAEARPLASASASAAASKAAFSTLSQVLKDFEADKKNPNKQIGSSFRRIPPSTSNPTQNSYEAGEKYNSWIGIATFVFTNNPSKLVEIHSIAHLHPNEYQTTSTVSFPSAVPSPRYHVVDRKKPLPSDSLTTLLSRASSHVPC
ncbi:hypothetical protein COP2_047528 [Malus domestica]